MLNLRGIRGIILSLVLLVSAFLAVPAFASGTVTLSADKTQVPCGTNVTLTATASGITNPTYQFWVRDARDENKWSSERNLGPDNKFSFTKNIPGTYRVVVYAVPANGGDAVQSNTIDVTFTAKGMVSNLVVNGPRGSQKVGTSATFTATATDEGGIPKYSFWLHDADGWRIVQEYSDKNTYTMSNLQPGSYVIVAQALDEKDIAAGNWDKTFFKSFVLNVGSSVTLNAPSSGTVNKPVTLTAAATGLTNPVYQFWYQDPQGAWHGSNYTESPEFSFTPTAEGTYTTIVYAKDPYAPADWTHSVWSEVKTITVGQGPHVVLYHSEPVYFATPDSFAPSPYNVAGARFEAGLVDANGNLIYNNGASYTIHAAMTGPGILNIDTKSQEYSISNLYTPNDGKLTLFPIAISLSDQPGTIKLTVEVEGFIPATYQFDYVPPTN